MTRTANEALNAMTAHHRELDEGVGRRVAALRRGDGEGDHRALVADLVAFLVDEVLVHAWAEERTLYRADGSDDVLVGQFLEEHRALAAAVEGLAAASGVADVCERAEAIAALFTAHVTRENEELLAPLLAGGGADLASLANQMRRLSDERRASGAPQDEPPESDPLATVLASLVEATVALARAGESERAGALLASAWAALRTSRPDLAVRATAALHRVARVASPQPVSLSPHSSAARAPTGETLLDVRDLAPAGRHESIFAAYHALAPDQAFVLVNDHDPTPLRYQFEAEHAGAFTWEYLEPGPRVWRVRLGRTVGNR
ncbi:MAG: DUF2249 domain-containing protein [Acidimicrobiales bacterium]